MSFSVREISPVNPKFLLIPDLSSDSHDNMQSFASVPSLPYALSDFDINQVKSECLKYISNISKCPLHVLEILDGDTSKIVWRSLAAVWRFLGANLAARQAGTLLSTFTKTRKSNQQNRTVSYTTLSSYTGHYIPWDETSTSARNL
jgi:hypothetical protein